MIPTDSNRQTRVEQLRSSMPPPSSPVFRIAKNQQTFTRHPSLTSSVRPTHQRPSDDAARHIRSSSPIVTPQRTASALRRLAPKVVDVIKEHVGLARRQKEERDLLDQKLMSNISFLASPLRTRARPMLEADTMDNAIYRPIKEGLDPDLQVLTGLFNTPLRAECKRAARLASRLPPPRASTAVSNGSTSSTHRREAVHVLNVSPEDMRRDEVGIDGGVEDAVEEGVEWSGFNGDIGMDDEVPQELGDGGVDGREDGSKTSVGKKGERMVLKLVTRKVERLSSSNPPGSIPADVTTKKGKGKRLAEESSDSEVEDDVPSQSASTSGDDDSQDLSNDPTYQPCQAVPSGSNKSRSRSTKRSKNNRGTSSDRSQPEDQEVHASMIQTPIQSIRTVTSRSRSSGRSAVGSTSRTTKAVEISKDKIDILRTGMEQVLEYAEAARELEPGIQPMDQIRKLQETLDQILAKGAATIEAIKDIDARKGKHGARAYIPQSLRKGHGEGEE